MKVGVFQSACSGLSFAERLQRLETQIHRKNLDLVVCPELFASGYNVGDHLKKMAEPAKGHYLELASQFALSHRCALIFGYPEKHRGIIYNSTLFLSANGELVANHRKRANSPGSFEEDYFVPGLNGPTLVEYKGIKIGILICYEVEFPESVRQLAKMGAQFVAVPTALVDQWNVVAETVVPTRAFENGVWLAYANHAGEENGFRYLGGSRIVAPDGSQPAVAGANEQLITTEIELSRVDIAQARLPYLRDCPLFSNQSKSIEAN